MKRHPLGDCEACPLNEDDCVFVPSYGPEKVDVVVVGEAPGVREAQQGRPFTGPSGELIRLVLVEKGIDPDSVFWTNACLCRPPQNATPPAEAVKCCSKRLEAEVHGREPRTLLALGNTAAQHILQTKDGITKLRVGSGREAPAYAGIRIVPSIHPAACLRQGDMFPSLVADVGKINNDVAITWEPPTFKVFDTEREATLALLELLHAKQYPFLAVDIEVGVDKDEFDHPDRYSMLCIGLSYAAGRAIVLGEQACASDKVRALLRKLLESKALICHNGKFDLAGLLSYCQAQATLYFDTMLASYCLDERPGTNSLEFCGTEFLGCPSWKSELNKYKSKNESYAIVPRKVLYQYNAWDCAVTFLLYEYFAKELEAQGLRPLHDFLCRASGELMYPELEGVVVDLPYNEMLTETYLDSLAPLEQSLKDVSGWATFNPRSPKQVMQVFDWAGLHPASTDANTLIDIMEKTKDDEVREFCDLMLSHRREAKLYGTYVKGIRKRLYRGRVHPTFLLHGTVSGRLSCRNPNLQNIPRESSIRKQFVPAPGNVFLQGDYGQAELRVMATLSGDAYLREVFNDPTRDLFDEVGERLYGARAVGDKVLRIRTKAYVYGLSYGREEFSIAMEYKLSVKEARRGMDAWMSLIPELNQWRKDLMRSVLTDQEDLVTTFGRHRRFWLITNENRKDVLKEALSFYPQSTASDICLSALMQLRKELGNRGNVRIPVHDSILVESSRSDANDVALLMKDVMEQAGRDWTDFVPFPVDVEQGMSWGELAK